MQLAVLRRLPSPVDAAVGIGAEPGLDRLDGVAVQPARFVEMNLEARALACPVVGGAAQRQHEVEHVLAPRGAALFAGLVGVVNQQHRDAGAAQVHQQILDVAPAIGAVVPRADEAGEIVEHQQLGLLAPALDEMNLSLGGAEIGDAFLVEIGQQEGERGWHGAEQTQPLLHIDRRHFAIDVADAMRSRRPPVQELAAARHRPGDAHRHEGLAQPARSIEQGKALGREERVEDRLARRQVGRHQFRRGEAGRHRLQLAGRVLGHDAVLHRNCEKRKF